jgi:seryl-tRNA synthetase
LFIRDRHKLAELKRLQEDLERERASLEEARRRQGEFQMGREEMVNHLTRGLGLLNEAEFAARRDAEQMSKTIADLRESLVKVQAIQDSSWTQETWNVELTRALTIIENARMEWNGARLKWTLLDGSAAAQKTGATETFRGPNALGQDFRQWCKLGLALTWPLLLLGLIFGVIFLLRS